MNQHHTVEVIRLVTENFNEIKRNMSKPWTRVKRIGEANHQRKHLFNATKLRTALEPLRKHSLGGTVEPSQQRERTVVQQNEKKNAICAVGTIKNTLLPTFCKASVTPYQA